MKISKSLRDIHSQQVEVYLELQQRVADVMLHLKDQRWHYESRVKELESYALKVESGRHYDLNDLDDFFACTLVVENIGSLAKAERLVKSKFKFQERRPKTDQLTSMPANTFRFDDTRLYVRWKDDPNVRPTRLKGLLFEVQIKTFLAHAWSIASHDLIYKVDEKSWPKERIAFQIKAMLEHAETSIQTVKKLAASPSLKKTDALSRRITAVIDLINELWQPISLPNDKKRLAENIDSLLTNVKIDSATLRKVLVKETELGRGTKILNLSPYATIVQSLLNREPRKMKTYLTGRKHSFKIYIPREVELPVSFSSDLTNAMLDTTE